MTGEIIHEEEIATDLTIKGANLVTVTATTETDLAIPQRTEITLVLQTASEIGEIFPVAEIIVVLHTTDLSPGKKITDGMPLEIDPDTSLRIDPLAADPVEVAPEEEINLRRPEKIILA